MTLLNMNPRLVTVVLRLESATDRLLDSLSRLPNLQNLSLVVRKSKTVFRQNGNPFPETRISEVAETSEVVRRACCMPFQHDHQTVGTRNWSQMLIYVIHECYPLLSHKLWLCLSYSARQVSRGRVLQSSLNIKRYTRVIGMEALFDGLHRLCRQEMSPVLSSAGRD